MEEMYGRLDSVTAEALQRTFVIQRYEHEVTMLRRRLEATEQRLREREQEVQQRVRDLHALRDMATLLGQQRDAAMASQKVGDERGASEGENGRVSE